MLIRPFTAADLPAYRSARLTALQAHPDAYSSSWEEEREYGDEIFMGRILPRPPNTALGAFLDGELCGMGALIIPPQLKTRHVGSIVSIYVAPGFRGAGTGRAVMLALLEAARAADLLVVHLTVSVGNDKARRLYAELGFRSHGIARRALRIGDQFVDDEFMSLDLD